MFYTRRQANAETEATTIERDRRHAERRPEFKADIEDVNGDGGFYRLWVTLTTAEMLEALDVELPTPCSFEFVTSITGVTDNRHARSYEGPIVENGRACWRVTLVEGIRRDREHISVVARHSSDEWLRTVVVDVPYDVMDSIR